MPEIELKHIVSCSSEDRNNPAENLLSAEGTRKWRTAVSGEKSATAVIQFEKSSQITGIDIGNEGSAFVEVLVGRSTAAGSDYQVLLMSSSFMSPADSRNGTNRNSVRMFSADKLSKTVSSEKWDRVKIVCTQPFNKSTTYGLSFIKFLTGSDSSKTTVTEKGGVKKLGAFFIKKGVDEEDEDIKVGTLFANKDRKETAAPALTGAAAVRAASRQIEESRASTSRTSTTKGGNAGTAPSSISRTIVTPAKPSPKKHAVSDEGSDSEEEAPTRRPALKRQSSSLSSVTSNRSSEARPPLKKIKTEPPKSSPAKVFSQLMGKVTFVLSGFQNPYRGELRDKALEMGAVYKPDWGKGCTHLICAFSNTPKYNQVKGRGRIVSKEWVNDCHKQKKLSPWRNYRLGKAESPDETSDEEEEAPVTPKAASRKTASTSSSKAGTSASPQASQKKVAKWSDDPNKYGGDTDTAEDTDEEIRRAEKKASPATTTKQPEKQQKGKAKAEVKVESAKLDPTLLVFADSTDEDVTEEDEPKEKGDVDMGSDDGNDLGLPDLPDFFAEKHFFFYGDFQAADKRLLTRYIAAYDGVLEDYMTDRVKYVVTSSGWDENFDQALTENPHLVFVKPQWIRQCHNKTKLLPYQSFIVVP